MVRDGRGYTLLHPAPDAYSRLTHSDILTNERKEPGARSWECAGTVITEARVTATTVMPTTGPATWLHCNQSSQSPPGRRWSEPSDFLENVTANYSDGGWCVVAKPFGLIGSWCRFFLRCAEPEA